MEIEFLAWFEIVLSIENLNEKWGQRNYRIKISNFYSYCMTILIYFLQPFSYNPIVMEKSPHSSSLLLSMAFSRSNLQKQTWFQLTDTVPCQISSWVSYKAEYQLKGPDIPRNRYAMTGEKGISWWSGPALAIWTSGRVPLWEDNDFPWLPAIFSPGFLGEFNEVWWLHTPIFTTSWFSSY